MALRDRLLNKSVLLNKNYVSLTGKLLVRLGIGYQVTGFRCLFTNNYLFLLVIKKNNKINKHKFFVNYFTCYLTANT
jgi:hypothetical protein